jgi:formylglycine-generating enzyme required for sulfatase activity
MVKISSAGKEFQMGSNNWEENEKPVHTVKFTYDFYISKTEVIQRDYKALMGVNPSSCKGDRQPVELVNWYDAALYCNALSKKEGFDTVYSYASITGTPGDSCELNELKTDLRRKGYRLPTEAEWEYACRGGTTTEYYWGDSDDSAIVSNYAWYRINCDSSTHPAGGKLPNNYGLYDMNGNVFEWCNDWSEEEYYLNSPLENPEGPVTGSYRAMRGGSWGSSASSCRSAIRRSGFPGSRSVHCGFRLVLVP